MQAVGPESKDQKKGPSKSWRFCHCRAQRDVSVGEGGNRRLLWDCCGNCKTSPQSFKPLQEKQDPVMEKKQPNVDRLDVRALTTHNSLILTSTTPESTSTIGVSSFSTLESTIQSMPSIYSEMGNLSDLDIIVNMMETPNCEEQSILDNNEEKISFLHAISASCMTAHKSGKDTLDLPYTKNELVEALLMVMETLPVHSVPSFLLSCSMLTVYNLSKMKPPFDPEQLSGILRLALHGIFNMDTDLGNPHSQALYQSSADTMEIMLKGVLSEVPTTSHLMFILKHINFWIHSNDPQERYRSVLCSTTVLRHALLLPDFNKSSELPALGHHVAQFGICITDTMKDVSNQARLTISCLYELLLDQMGDRKIPGRNVKETHYIDRNRGTSAVSLSGLSVSEAEELWCHSYEDQKMLAYVDSCRVGELFRNIFTEDQTRTFLETSLRAIYNPELRIREAGILLVFSHLGKANEIMADKAEDIAEKIYQQIYKLQILREVPEALQGFFPSRGNATRLKREGQSIYLAWKVPGSALQPLIFPVKREFDSK
ncbi:maestro heat-like repeat-containing protein family member 7 [Podarcis muralis]